ncbi:copper-fist-domain-containing protein [Aspergillus campestris IBT 28561]|uniref:Copper-fist-domain-containing protein n=1 Tax=Aspergillus campestris (strain IBT 28561) TaxID=1392248 RepID=A0A2I1D5H4_ASPC2|nr:copper-fist-domain-containing protein [Aspergillus campestris IBT 28561]PKY05120.1 copper-fist-domain-containing protein [Aspergillus campestris IBT 28561]
MLIDGEKWACEACVRGHRVTTCKHHDRPLTKINRKGRPFSTCAVCNLTPCPTPDDHARLRRAEKQRSDSLSHTSTTPPARVSSRSSPTHLVPIAPRPPTTQSPSPNNSLPPHLHLQQHLSPANHQHSMMSDDPASRMLPASTGADLSYLMSSAASGAPLCSLADLPGMVALADGEAGMMGFDGLGEVDADAFGELVLDGDVDVGALGGDWGWLGEGSV